MTGSNITNYETKTVQAAFAPGGEPQITANWTGVSLWSILQAAGIPAGASNVTVTGIDGYSQDYHGLASTEHRHADWIQRKRTILNAS